MLPLPYATKENYKVVLYRLCDSDADKVKTPVHFCRFVVVVVICMYSYVCVCEFKKEKNS